MSNSEFKTVKAKYSLGELVQHKLFDYRGVIMDVDAEFQLSTEWYETMARSRPPKDKPWYHVLVHEATHSTYVAEQNLVADLSGDKISHPLIEQHFTDFRNGRYIIEVKIN